MKPKKPLFGKSRMRKLLQDPVMRAAYDAGKGLGISSEASKPAWEQERVRKIIWSMEI